MPDNVYLPKELIAPALEPLEHAQIKHAEVLSRLKTENDLLKSRLEKLERRYAAQEGGEPIRRFVSSKVGKEVLGVSESTFWRYAREGLFKTYYMGDNDTRRYALDELYSTLRTLQLNDPA